MYKMIWAIVLSMTVAVGGLADMQSYVMTPTGFDSKSMPHIRILDTKMISFEKHNDLPFTEISDLAYDDEKKLLYAISDHGILYHLKMRLADKTIKALDLLAAYPITNSKGKPYKKSKRDAEGLALLKGELLISFERRPRVLLCDAQGRQMKKMKIAKVLRDIKNYRSKNSALEAVTYHQRYGVITAPERPLHKHSKKEHTLYAEDRAWRFNAYASITALEVMDDGNMLVLERDFELADMRHVITLHKVSLDSCDNGLCHSEVLARFDSRKGWKLDNFEGLTHLSDNLYLMVSDDNDSLFQKTILVLFEIDGE